MQKPAPDLVRITLGVLSIGALIFASLWVMRPFLASTIWATMLVVATWPEMRWIQFRLRGRRGLAVLAMTLLLLLLFVLPLLIAFSTIFSHFDDIKSTIKSLPTMQIPAPPAWVGNLPLVGEKIVAYWNQVIVTGPSAMMAELTPYADNIAKWTVSQAGGIGALLVQFVLTIIIAVLMYAGGEPAALVALRFGRRLAGEQGE